MNVKRKSEQSKMLFSDVKVGEVFKDRNDNVLMKTQECKNQQGDTNNCINLETGLFCFRFGTCKVDKINGTFVEE